MEKSYNDYKRNIFELTTTDTLILKGIAILAMLVHHVYGCAPETLILQPYSGILGFLGNVGKVCVSIFLFCSGYGLAKQFEQYSLNKTNLLNIIKFIINRLIKFYAGYWPIFIIFVPLGVCLFDISLEARYGTNDFILKRLFYDIFGIQGHHSYNITWWFNKLILLLYFLFPFFYYIVKNIKYIAFCFSFGIMFFSDNYLSQYNYYYLLLWQFPFVLGIILSVISREKWVINLSSFLSNHKNITNLSIILITLLLLLQRAYTFINLPLGFDTIKLDGIITLFLVIGVSYNSFPQLVNSVLIFLGKHSMNIYMIHTFLYWYWFSQFFYSDLLSVSGLNALFLLCCCILLSLIIEKIKTITCYNKMVDICIAYIKKYKLVD